MPIFTFLKFRQKYVGLHRPNKMHHAKKRSIIPYRTANLNPCNTVVHGKLISMILFNIKASKHNAETNLNPVSLINQLNTNIECVLSQHGYQLR